ncbi:MAG: RNA polymerase sigma-70 factor [Bacteroidota bacterium]|nr:RNA polymerase sigma-70 factor [Bacteroidota bacterium]
MATFDYTYRFNLLKPAEEILFDRIKKDDRHAFEELFRRFYSGLCRYAESIMKDETLAEDVVQLVFINIWEKRKELIINKNFKSYLFRSTFNTCLNQIKQKELSKKSSQALAILHSGIEQSFLIQIEADELERKIKLAIESLPQKCRLVFDLSRFEGLKNKEVATRLNLSIKTVEAHISKALNIIRSKIYK